MSLRHYRIPLITLAALPLLLTACQEASSIAVTNRQAVSGEVTLDGEPLRAATIQFIPKGARHPVATALVASKSVRKPALHPTSTTSPSSPPNRISKRSTTSPNRAKLTCCVGSTSRRSTSSPANWK